MSKVSCNIIKDLLPSYLDGICSEDTKQFVEVHIKECETCRTLANMMQKTQLVSEKTDRKTIDYMKKIKIQMQKLMGLGLLLVLIVLGMIIVITHYGAVPVIFFYGILPVLLFVLQGVLWNYPVSEKKTKWKIGMEIAVLFFIGCSIGMEFLCMQWVKSGTYPFQLEPAQLGPFFYRLFMGNTWIQIGIFLAALLLQIKTAVSYQEVMDGCILGCCLNLSFLALLKRMDTIEEFAQKRNQNLGILFIEWMIITGIFYLLKRKNKK